MITGDRREGIGANKDSKTDPALIGETIGSRGSETTQAGSVNWGLELARIQSMWERLNAYPDAVCAKCKEIVEANAAAIAKLGEWPERIDAKASLVARIPTPELQATGFDAGIGLALGLIPFEQGGIVAKLHAAYTPEVVKQVITEMQNPTPDSQAVWWLSACSVCKEGKHTPAEFLEQIGEFQQLVLNPAARLEAAKAEYFKMIGRSHVSNEFGVPVAYGTVDGCIQGSYLKGHPVGLMKAENYGIFFLGTTHPSLGLESFQFSDEKDDAGRAKSGPVFNSRQFVKLANEDEVRRALEVVSKHFEARGIEL
jgi:hypothetical protein